MVNEHFAVTLFHALKMMRRGHVRHTTERHSCVGDANLICIGIALAERKIHSHDRLNVLEMVKSERNFIVGIDVMQLHMSSIVWLPQCDVCEN